LFSRQLRYWTFVGVLFCLGTPLAIWTSNIWLPTIQGQMLARHGITGPAAAPPIGHGMMLWGLGGICGYAVYLPELFPTHVRATAVSFCNGSGRAITSLGPLVAGLLAAPFGGDFAKATAFTTCFALLSILAMALGRETRDDELPR
jgi:hypothetical protein